MKVYIVYLGEHSRGKSFEEIEEIHHSYLHSVKGSKEEAKACVVYSYKNVINGFSALLTPQEAHRLSGSCMHAFLIYINIISNNSDNFR